MTELAIIEQLKLAIGQKRTVQGINLSGLDCRKVDLSELAVEGLIARRTNFEYALFTLSQLIEADFTEAILNGADFQNANIGLSTFNQASMREVCLKYSIFINGYCDNVNLESADLTSSDLEGSSFFSSCLNRVLLRNVNGKFGGFNRTQMVEADLSGGNFTKATFAHSDLTGANLSGGDFSKCDFRGANLTEVCWTNATLVDTKFDPNCYPL